ncbi:HD domain-containing protein [Desulfovibrio inopinatus]|uniref:HD domain-containing protein n=1 Tax=Desulfovibrio inopinatus TaxID=102109 RepID=UPI0003FBF2C8|nr:HD domain-containing protein [Desulfovibrio inopinatus]
MPIVRKSLLQLVFSGAYMQRWNDKHRTMTLTEIDKQAHKMMVAWMLFHENSRSMPPEDRLALGNRIVEGGIFEYLYRLVITDIKPPIFYQIRANPAHYRQLTDWVLAELEPRVRSMGEAFWSRLCEYLAVPEADEPARRILDAAHVYASGWEHQLIKPANPWDDELIDIETSFRQGLEKAVDLRGVPQLISGLFGEKKTPLGHFAQICGQLRFQTRWSQTPRIPETSVLGHLFIMACYAYFLSLSVDACSARRQNNFFAGLFHDLPELLTRDIISPVKKSVQRIGDLIKEYENSELDRRILTPLRQAGYVSLADRLSYFLGLAVGSEFFETIIMDRHTRKIDPEQLQSDYNSDDFDPKDGALLKVADSLSAFLEAYTAIRNGIASNHLQQALWRIRNQYSSVTLFGQVHIGTLLADFD